MAGSYSDAVGGQIEVVTPLLGGFFDKAKALYAKFSKVQVKSQSGRDMRMPMELRPGGQTRIANLDGGDFGAGSGPLIDFTAMSPIDKVHVISWTLKAKFTTDGSEKAVVDYAQRTIAGAITEATVREDKHLQTSGNGVLATISGVAGAVLTCAVTAAAPFGTRLLRVGDSVGIWAAALGVGDYRGAGVIKKISYAANEVELVSAVAGTIPTDLILIGGLTTSPPVATYGIPYQHNNSTAGTFLGKTRADYPEFITPWVDGDAGVLTVEKGQKLLVLIDSELGEDTTETGSFGWYMNPKQHYAVVGQMSNIAEISLPMGGSGNGQVDLAFTRKKQRIFCGFPIESSINCDPSRVDFIDFKNFLRGSYKDLGWQKINGSVIATTPNSGSYNAEEMSVLIWSQQYACRNPRRGGYISGLKIPF